MNTDKIYSITKRISDTLLNVLEKLSKEFVGTYVGQRFLKFITDFIVSRLFKEVAEPMMRVGVIKLNYYFDVNDSKNRIKRLVVAKESENEDLYRSTLNDIVK